MTRPVWPSGATATRCPRGWVVPSSPSGTGWGPPASRSLHPRASSSCPMLSPNRAQAPWCAPRPTGLPSKWWCSPSSAPSVLVTARPTNHLVRSPWPSGHAWSKDQAPTRASTSVPWPRSSPWPSPERPRPGRCRHRHQEVTQVVRELHPGGLGFVEAQFFLEVFVHYIDHPVAESPEEKQRAHQDENEHQVLPVIGYEKALLGGSAHGVWQRF